MRVANGGTPERAAAWAARFMAGIIRDAIRARGQAHIALSGGSSVVPLLDALVALPVDWPVVNIFQVDERVVARGHPDRNLTALEERLVARGPVPFRQLHPLWVDRADLEEAATACEEELRSLAGSPPRLDVVHLGLGEDGHTASLFPGDPVLDERGRAVAVTGEHAGYRRMTLTYPVLDEARAIVWFVLGAAKAPVVRDLAAGQGDAPAVAVNRRHAVLVADSAASALLPRDGLG